MTHFAVALYSVLKDLIDEGVSREVFAKKIGLALNTLRNYANGNTKPDAEDLARICGALGRERALLLLGAHLRDCTPAVWRDEIERLLSVGAGGPEGLVAEVPTIPRVASRFQRHLELLEREGAKNPNLVALVQELVQCLGLPESTGKLEIAKSKDNPYPSAASTPCQNKLEKKERKALVVEPSRGRDEKKPSRYRKARASSGSGSKSGSVPDVVIVPKRAAAASHVAGTEATGAGTSGKAGPSAEAVEAAAEAARKKKGGRARG